MALVFTGSSMPRITNSIIAENDIGIMTFDFSSPRIIGNLIEKNKLWGISCYDFFFPMISHNTIGQSEEEVVRYLTTLRELGINKITCFTVDMWKPLPPAIHEVYPDGLPPLIVALVKL